MYTGTPSVEETQRLMVALWKWWNADRGASFQVHEIRYNDRPANDGRHIIISCSYTARGANANDCARRILRTAELVGVTVVDWLGGTCMSSHDLEDA